MSTAIFSRRRKWATCCAFRLAVKQIGTSSFTLAVQAEKDGQVRVRATLVLVLGSLTARRPIPITPEMRVKLGNFVVE